MTQLVFERTQEYHDRFRQALDEGDSNYIINSLEEVKPADITELLKNFSDEESIYVLELLPIDVQSSVIRELESNERKTILPLFAPDKLATLINELDSDDAADILNDMPILFSEAVILQLDEEHRHQVVDLLRYPDNVAGGIMAKELIKVRNNWTIVQCAKEIRKQAMNVSRFYAVYVVDENDTFLGQISLQQIVLSNLRSNVGDLIDDEPISVESYIEDKEVAEIMRKYDLESIAVVNHGRLIGRITIDDIVDVITEQAEEERQIMSGITEDIEEDDSVWRNTRARLPWLLIGIVGGLLNARLMGLFETDLARITAIAFFVPLIQATGGNVGIQSSTLIVQSLASGNFIDSGIWKRLFKVFVVAILNGLFLSLLVLGANILVFGDYRLSFVVSASLFINVIFASLVGSSTPLLLDRMSINPALASGPFITSLNDLLGLTVYFVTIRILM